MGAQKIVQAADVILQPAVTASRGEGLYQTMELRVLLLIQQIKREAHRVGAHHTQLTRVGNADIAVDVEQEEILLAQRHAERVHRRDMRFAEQGLLTDQKGIGGIPANAVGQRVPEPALELGGSLAGIGHDQQSVGVNAVFGIGDQADHTLDQYGGLARSGGSRNNHGTAPRGDRVELMLCPVTCHRDPPPL